MRWPILALLAMASPAAADGVYVGESLGGASYQGDLSSFGGGAPRLQLAGGYVRGPWAVEASITGMVPDLFYIDCYGDECLAAAAPTPGLTQVGLDLRRAYRIVYSTWTNKIGLDMVLHGGPRWFVGQDALERFAGPGLGGGAGLDLNLKVFSMFVDLGVDLPLLRSSDGDTLTGRLPYLAFGGRVGWM